jgi:hypothetical protein
MKPTKRGNPGLKLHREVPGRRVPSRSL